MQDNKPPSAVDIVRCVATARVTMPRSVVRLSAGRLNFSLTDQVRSWPHWLYRTLQAWMVCRLCQAWINTLLMSHSARYACISATLLCTNMMFTHEHLAVHAPLDLCLQAAARWRVLPHITKQEHHLSHAVDFEMCDHPRTNGNLCMQALCFMAGANSIFDGDKLLTTKNNERNADLEMFEELGLKSRPAFVPYPAGASSSDGSAVHGTAAAQHLAGANQLATAATVAAVQQQPVASS